MKKYILSLSVCLIFITVEAQNISKVQTKITSAKIFLKGANISRITEVNIPKGESLLKIVNLPHDIDTKTIKLKIGKDVLINAVSPQYNFEEKQKLTAETKLLKERLDSIQVVIGRKKLEIGAIQDKIDLIHKNSALTSSQSLNVVGDLAEMLDIYDTRLKTYRQDMYNQKLALKKIEDKNMLISKQLSNTMNKKTQPTLEITAEINSDRAITSSLVLEYFTKNAAWYPKYDARVQEINTDLKLNMKAQIIQTTPESWKNVKITLSNALPDNSATRPVLEKWQLTYSRYTRIKNTLTYGSDLFIGKVSGKITDESGEALIGANIVVKGTSIGTISDLDGFYEMNVPQDAKSLEVSYVGYENRTVAINSNNINIALHQGPLLSEVVVTAYAMQGRASGITVRGANSIKKAPAFAEVSEKYNAVEYEIIELQNLRNDGSSKTIKIKDFDLPAIYEYHSVPKIKPNVYIIARIPDWDQYFFLEGEMNLYFEDTYVGQSILASNIFSDTLDLSLGKDYNVKVNREEESADSRKSFIGTFRIDSRNYSISVNNQKSQAINIFIHDQFPVSIIKDVDVTLTEWSGATIDEGEGELTWNFQLGPKRQEIIDFAYKVKYPKREKIILD